MLGGLSTNKFSLGEPGVGSAAANSKFSGDEGVNPLASEGHDSEVEGVQGGHPLTDAGDHNQHKVNPVRGVAQEFEGGVAVGREDAGIGKDEDHGDEEEGGTNQVTSNQNQGEDFLRGLAPLHPVVHELQKDDIAPDSDDAVEVEQHDGRNQLEGQNHQDAQEIGPGVVDDALNHSPLHRRHDVHWLRRGRGGTVARSGDVVDHDVVRGIVVVVGRGVANVLGDTAAGSDLRTSALHG